MLTFKWMLLETSHVAFAGSRSLSLSHTTSKRVPGYSSEYSASLSLLADVLQKLDITNNDLLTKMNIPYFPTDNAHLTYNAHPKLFYIPFEVQITRT